MRMAMLSFMHYLLGAIRVVSRRLSLVERMLGVDLSPRELESVRNACRISGCPLGAYYYWKISQAIQAALVRCRDGHSILTFILKVDASDHSRLESLIAEPKGCVLAIPHHGPFIFSIVALLERIRHERPVFVFYDPPEVHAANELFDGLYRALYKDSSSGVTILHNNQRGIAMALRQLRRGAFVVIMPDVYRSRENTYRIPFFGRSRDVMLGVSALARRSQASILPVVPEQCEASMKFVIRFGRVIEPESALLASGAHGFAEDLYADYRRTVVLFNQFEKLMHRRLMHWQYCSSHFSGDTALPPLGHESLAEVSRLLLADPRIHVDLSEPFVLQ